MRILFFGTYDAGRHPHVRVLQEGFDQLGDTVIECNEPLGFSTAQRVQMVRRPWLGLALIARVARCWWRLWRRARTLRNVDAVFVGYMGHFDVHLARRLWPKALIALDHMIFFRDTAIDRGIGSRPVLAMLNKIDTAAVRTASVVCVDTEEHRRMLPTDSRSVVLLRGATKAWFREPEPIGEPLRVIFYGTFSPLQGTRTIGEAIAACTDMPIHFTIAGTGQEYSATRTLAAHNPNVEWIDWIEPSALPSVVATHHVCLGIFGTGPKAARVVPHKAFEGAAAGCAIVTADTEPQRRILGDAAVFVPAGDAQALASTLDGLARDPDRVHTLREASYRTACAAFHPRLIAEQLRRELTRA
ncbi:MAG: glycosyltransferase [Actinomycetota bacterium]|nr:glycosyltransferase [Actinomycetota bacterium]